MGHHPTVHRRSATSFGLTSASSLARAGAPLAAAALTTAADGYTPVLLAIGTASLIAAAGILTRANTPQPT